MPCRVCGREGYADICSECMFREQNQQCWRCRIYIPMAEMQQWRGQWICPNCRMDLEREEGGAPGGRGKPEEEAAAELHEKKGRCDRCGRETIILYKFNGRNLCWYCLEKEDTYAGAGGAGGAIPLRLMRERKKKKGLLRRIREFFFGRGPEDEGAVEITSAKVVPIRKRGREGEIVPVKRAGEPEIVPKKGEEPEKRGEKERGKEERRGKGPLVEKERGEPPTEGKEKKKPEWGGYKRD